MTKQESTMISNLLKMGEISIEEIMTPRTVVTALDKEMTLRNLFEEHPNIPFARMPVFEEHIDNIVGLVRRKDLLRGKAEDLDVKTVGDLMGKVLFVPENANAANTLKEFLKNHQQLQRRAYHKYQQNHH